jgi:esterase/lipase
MKKAVLIVHGFVGTLYDNEYLMNYLELDPRYDVYARTLPGHYKERFSNANVADWKEFVDKQIEELIRNGYHTIYVVGHSMGGILTTYVAGKYKQIKKIVLINAAFDYGNTRKGNSKESLLAVILEKLQKTSPFILYEFTKLVKESKIFLSGVNCDTLILRSLNDEIVPYNTGDIIYNKINSKKKWITDIKDAPHTVLSSDRKEVVSGYIRDFLKGGRRWKKNKKEEI